MNTASEIALHIVDRMVERRSYLNNMGLQRVLYRARSLYYTETGDILFGDTAEAWMSGPVFPGVYHEYRVFGATDIFYRRGEPVALDPKTAVFLDRFCAMVAEGVRRTKGRTAGAMGPGCMLAWAERYVKGEHRQIPFGRTVALECDPEYWEEVFTWLKDGTSALS